MIQALLDQRTDGTTFEVLIVDNGSTDGTAAAVRRFTSIDPRVRYILEPSQGASYARNAGIRCARGSIVAFLDDDVVPAADWIPTLKRAFVAHPDIDCIGGRVDPLWPGRVPRWLTPLHYAPLALQTVRPREFDAGHASACLITANFACRRNVFAEVGGFATEFTRDEDREFNLRLWRAGKRGLFDEQVRVVAPIDPGRLTKRYHRRWYETTGMNHARLRYREIIDRHGRLIAPVQRHTVLGVPAFVYKEAIIEAGRWVLAAVRGRLTDAFYHECRVRYYLSYVTARARLLLQQAA